MNLSALAALSEYDLTVQSHACYFDQLLRELRLASDGPGASTALHLLALELPNMLQALDTAVARRDDALLLPLVRNLYAYLHGIGQSPLLARMLRRVLRDASPGPAVQLQCKAGLAMCLSRQGQPEVAEQLAREALALAGTPAQELTVRLVLGWVLMGASHFQEALAEGQRAELLCDDPTSTTLDRIVVLNLLAGVNYMLGNFEQSARQLEGAMELCEGGQYLTTLAIALGNHAFLDIEAGDFRAARRHASRSIALHRRLGVRLAQIYALGALAHLDYEEGDFGGCLAISSQGLKLATEAGDRPSMVDLQLWQGVAHWKLQQPAEAALCGLAILEAITLGVDSRRVVEVQHLAAALALRAGDARAAGILALTGMDETLSGSPVSSFVGEVQALVLAQLGAERLAELQLQRAGLPAEELLRQAARLLGEAASAKGR